jgi:predicted O-methyltransferase YrrM
MLETSEIQETIRRHHFKGMGAVSEYDVRFLCDLIDKYRPRNVFELGVASGMSTTFLLRSLERVSNKCMLYSVDFGENYYVDPSKKVGYLVNEIIPNPGCQFELHRGCWAGDAERILGGQKLDLVFIDANHMHPWPTIDTMLLMPLTTPDAIVAHHDIALHTKPGHEHGIGPFNVFDEFPQPKFVSPCEQKNIGAFQLANSLAEYESILLRALEKPWTITNPMGARLTKRINECVACHYSPSFAASVAENLAKNINALIEQSEQKKSA